MSAFEMKKIYLKLNMCCYFVNAEEIRNQSLKQLKTE